MIRTRRDLTHYLEADRLALGREHAPVLSKKHVAAMLFPDLVWRFQRVLRKLEYHHNRRQDPVARLIRARLYRQYLHLSNLLGFTIPINVFGPGLAIAHRGTIVVNTGTRVGANCRLHVCVNIGTEAGKFHAAPRIGDNVYIGPGAKIYGDIVIADGCAIGANAVVNRSFEEPGSVIAGVPARKIGETDTSNLLIRATDILEKRSRV